MLVIFMKHKENILKLPLPEKIKYLDGQINTLIAYGDDNDLLFRTIKLRVELKEYHNRLQTAFSAN